MMRRNLVEPVTIELVTPTEQPSSLSNRFRYKSHVEGGSRTVVEAAAIFLQTEQSCGFVVQSEPFTVAFPVFLSFPLTRVFESHANASNPDLEGPVTSLLDARKSDMDSRVANSWLNLETLE